MIGILTASVLMCAAAAAPLDGQTFKITLETSEYGPLDAIVAFDTSGRTIVGVSSSTAAAAVRAMTIDEEAQRWDGRAMLTLQLRSQRDGAYRGRALTPFGASDVVLQVEQGTLSGRIASGPLAGPLAGAVYGGGDAPLRDYSAILAAVDQMLPAALFDPRMVQGDTYRAYRRDLGAVAALTRDDLDFVLASDLGWSERTFSHFGLARRSTSQIVAEVDASEEAPVELAFDDGVAIFRVNTFLGQNAVEQIKAGFREIDAADPIALIVDLRGTPGGSLAAKTLIEGLISQPMDMGWFTANAWWRAHDAAPTAQEIASQPVSDFSDPQAAFRTLMSEGLLRVEVRPAEHVYAGPVFVLIDGETASVAELAAATLGGSGRAVLIGERTAGELLTADTLPLPEGFALMTPLADYSDARLGRVEGVGVAPHIEVRSARAMSRALRLARRAR